MGLPVWAALLFVGTLTHRPDRKTDLAGWSRYVTTGQFLASHLVASIVAPPSGPWAWSRWARCWPAGDTRAPGCGRW